MIDKKYVLQKFIDRFLIIFSVLFLFALFLYFPVFETLFFKDDNVINVYTYTDMVSQKTLHDFYKQTGIKVNLKYYDTNEELFAKFTAGGGKGYDLIFPSDYMLDLLIKKNLLHKINKNKLSNYDQLDKRLIAKYFDIENNYSVPYFWSTDGIIYNKKIIKNNTIDWDFIFKRSKYNYKICMVDNLREAIFIASLYLFGDISSFSDNRLLKIKKLLINQKKWVEIYLYSSLQYYLLSDVVFVAVSPSAFAKKIMEISDDFEYVLPESGSLLIIDNLAIPKECKRIDKVHKFIDFLISKKVIAYNSNLFGYNPSNKQAYELMQPKFANNEFFFPNDSMFDKLYLLHNNFDIKKIEELWLEVKLS